MERRPSKFRNRFFFLKFLPSFVSALPNLAPEYDSSAEAQVDSKSFQSRLSSPSCDRALAEEFVDPSAVLNDAKIMVKVVTVLMRTSERKYKDE